MIYWNASLSVDAMTRATSAAVMFGRDEHWVSAFPLAPSPTGRANYT
jgi:hypothetical protein